jgi:tetratricopeptide (TPR) repeat protein
LRLDQFIDHRKEKVLSHVPDLWNYRRQLGDQDEEISLSAFTTWEMSFQQIEANQKQPTHIGHFLTLAAFLANTDIHEQIFETYHNRDKPRPKWIDLFTSRGKWDSYKYSDVIAGLRTLSLLHTLRGESFNHRFSLHSLIRDWIQLRLKVEDRERYCIEAFLVITKSIATDDDINRSDFQHIQQILSHLDACVQNDAIYLDGDVHLGTSILRDPALRFVSFYTRYNRYQDAAEIFERTLEADREEFGVGDTQTLKTQRCLAEVYFKQGSYREADNLLKPALDLSVKKLGGDHIDVLEIVSSLAGVYSKQNRLIEAENLYRNTIAGLEKHLPHDHPKILTALGDLGKVYRNQGRRDEAIELYKRAVAGNERQLGPNHPDTLQTVVSLANVHRARCNYKEAEMLYT